MRVIFPLAIVAVFAWINPFAAKHLALFDPDEYSHIISHALGPITAFGGTFLMMVALKFFIDKGKSAGRIGMLGKRLRRWGFIRRFGMLLGHEAAPFLTPADMGLLVFTVVDGLGTYLGNVAGSTDEIGAKGGLGAFSYLEVFDASFSFDGVIGAFALTTNILLIAIGLGIGAMNVRSMTIMLIECGH